MPRRAVELVFDSGAYSAWRRRETIDLDAYIRFLLKHQEHVRGYVNLDVIPGTPGSVRSQAEVEESAKQGWANYRRMTKAGLDPMPVFHMGERWYWLEKMLDQGATYIGLGGVAIVRDSIRRAWLDEVFSHLCGSRGYPAVRVHGFGITAVKLIHRYPWYSVDSFSWVQFGAMGDGVVPQAAEDGGYDYNVQPHKVGFSRGSSRTGGVNPQHLRGIHVDVLGPRTKRHVLEYLEREGFDLALLQKSREARLRLNVRFFKRLVEHYTLKPFSSRGGGLFTAPTRYGAVEPVGRFRILFTADDNPVDAEILQAEGIRPRLISYYNFVKGSRFNVGHYVETGLIKRAKR